MLWIILPAYNEQGNIKPLLTKIVSVLDEINQPFRVVLVNDGSTDQTSEEARLTMPGERLRLIDRQINLGFAATLAEGFLAATQEADPDDHVVAMDADNTMPPSLIPSMLTHLKQGFDVVVASRYVHGAEVHGLSLSRRFLSLVANRLFRILLPIPGIKDYTCGYRAFRVGVLLSGIELHGDKFFTEPGFGATADILLKLRPLRPRATEVPLVLRYDLKATGSKMQVTKTVMQTLFLMARRLVGRFT